MTEPEALTRRNRRADAANERRLMADAIGVEARDILIELQVVGYAAETIALLELAPALDVAWADGTISEEEREVILRIGECHGVTPDRQVFTHLNCWLDAPPSDHLVDASIRAIRAMLETLQPDVRDAIRRKLIADYRAVAAASAGGVFGNRPANDERAALDRIITVLQGPSGSLSG